MSNTIYELSDEAFIELIKSSHNIGEVLFKLNLTVEGNTWGYNQVRQRMREIGIDGTYFIGNTNEKSKGFQSTVSDEDLFTKNCKHTRRVLRERILLNKALEYKCAICGIDSWKGNPISLELDHINGINNDNRLENLRFLCPNCHSQTITYGSRNSKKELMYSKETKEKVIEACNRLKNKDLVYKELRISRSIIKKILKDNKKRSIPNQKYVIRYDKNHVEMKRWGSIKEMSKDVFNSKETDATTIESVRQRFLRKMKNNPDGLWLDSYWKIINAEPVI